MKRYQMNERELEQYRNDMGPNGEAFETKHRRANEDAQKVEDMFNNIQIMPLEEGIYEAYLDSYTARTSKAGNPTLALKLSIHDMISDCWRSHTAYITQNGAGYIAENLQHQFGQKFNKFSELLNHMKEEQFYVELREAEDGSGFMQTLFLRGEIKTSSLDAMIDNGFQM